MTFHNKFKVKTLMALVLVGAFNIAQAAVETKQPGVLTIGSDLTWAPYDYLIEGKAAGFDADLMKLLSKSLGIKTQTEDTRFANLVLGLTGRHFDVIASALYITPERAKQISYIPYLKTGGSLMTLKGSDFKPQTQKDLCGKKVASLKGAAWVPALNKLSTGYCSENKLGLITVQEYASSPLAAQALLSHAADVQFDDAAVSQMLVTQTKGRLQITSKTILDPVIIGLGVAKENHQLLTALTDALEEQKKNGSYQALLKKYNLQEPSADEIAAAFKG
ncbi:ABC transporter substrate-binding protein [Klebsiella sp. NPDC088457]